MNPGTLPLLRSLVAAGLLLVFLSARAEGDAVRGAKAYQTHCSECHTVDKDDTGPRHAGIVGRRAGSLPGFDYSPALKASTIVWDAASLDRWIANPDAMVPKQAMDFKLSDAAARADIVAYLLTLKAK